MRFAVWAQLHSRNPWNSLWDSLFVANPIPNQVSVITHQDSNMNGSNDTNGSKNRNGSKHANGSNVFFCRRCTKIVCGNGDCCGWKVDFSAKNVVVLLSQCDNAFV